ncbi:MAG: DMT family transporter [Prolixibacteraceae bacterium]|mgnify:CR=1 FL=1|jgi:drug/metabolite transporter (DMT)-like permease|nr:DMT family transporter [Prolixibacteraceae bacterium]MBT6004922.1 DMT family transporter [Prolixibacteraceae bacterium]MBT6997551.1 DMT family transporter [Prolixibacteraceae bacterium]MBT7394555.1 DMT family transporter [Prolixibacteraceae bacterium]
MNSNQKAYFYAGLAVFFWSTVATAFKIALREFDFIQLIFYASGVTVVLLFFVLLFQQKLNLLFRQTPKQWLNSIFIGAFNPLLYYLVLFKAYSLLPAQVAQPLNMIWPITLALLSVPLLKQKIGWVSVFALFVSFIGVFFISSQGGISGFKNTNTIGVILAVGSSVLWSLYWIFNVRDNRDQIIKLFLNFAFGFVYLAVAVFVFSDFQLHFGESLYAVIYVGIFEVGITYIFWLKAMNFSTNNAKIGNLVFFAPFLSLVFIRFILKETIFITTFIGLFFIIAGVLLQQLEKEKL